VAITDAAFIVPDTEADVAVIDAVVSGPVTDVVALRVKVVLVEPPIVIVLDVPIVLPRLIVCGLTPPDVVLAPILIKADPVTIALAKRLRVLFPIVPPDPMFIIDVPLFWNPIVNELAALNAVMVFGVDNKLKLVDDEFNIPPTITEPTLAAYPTDALVLLYAELLTYDCVATDAPFMANEVKFPVPAVVAPILKLSIVPTEEDKMVKPPLDVMIIFPAVFTDPVAERVLIFIFPPTVLYALPVPAVVVILIAPELALTLDPTF
jgi:hypothetical protein